MAGRRRTRGITDRETTARYPTVLSVNANVSYFTELLFYYSFFFYLASENLSNHFPQIGSDVATCTTAEQEH